MPDFCRIDIRFPQLHTGIFCLVSFAVTTIDSMVFKLSLSMAKLYDHIINIHYNCLLRLYRNGEIFSRLGESDFFHCLMRSAELAKPPGEITCRDVRFFAWCSACPK